MSNVVNVSNVYRRILNIFSLLLFIIDDDFQDVGIDDDVMDILFVVFFIKINGDKEIKVNVNQLLENEEIEEVIDEQVSVYYRDYCFV